MTPPVKMISWIMVNLIPGLFDARRFVLPAFITTNKKILTYKEQICLNLLKYFD